ncbi:DinB family protein [Streptomyces sp. NPDC048383]|uniref:DinB family protein n=1 Tax=Streptomyces sp. NPDC048383 TaxID=3155386 RepID=UPI0034468900
MSSRTSTEGTPAGAPDPAVVAPVVRDVERIGPPLTAGERETLRAYLDFHRATLAMKCEGLGDEDLRRPASPPSTLSLLGLVRHMAEVERQWFRRTLGGDADVPHVWSDRRDFQAAYDTTGATMAEAFAAWRAEVEHARSVEAALVSLDVTAHVPKWEADVSARVVMLHMIHEYARHNGHADFLREAVDGTVGA